MTLSRLLQLLTRVKCSNSTLILTPSAHNLTIVIEQSFLRESPFYHLTPCDLFDVLSSNQQRMKGFFEKSLTKLLQQTLPEHLHKTVDCKYYNENSFNNFKKRYIPKLSLINFNIWPLNKHRLEFQCFLQCLDIEFDFIASSEIGKCNVWNNANYFRKL